MRGPKPLPDIIREQTEARRADGSDLTSVLDTFEAALARNMDSLADIIFMDTDKYRTMIEGK
jgi:hypothetical protein